MSIVYQYYRQGTTQIVAFTSIGAATSSILNTTALNHIAITSTVDAHVFITGSGSVVSAVTAGAGALGQFIMARTETVIPCVKASGISIWGLNDGTGYITEFLAE